MAQTVNTEYLIVGDRPCHVSTLSSTNQILLHLRLQFRAAKLDDVILNLLASLASQSCANKLWSIACLSVQQPTHKELWLLKKSTWARAPAPRPPLTAELEEDLSKYAMLLTKASGMLALTPQLPWRLPLSRCHALDRVTCYEWSETICIMVIFNFSHVNHICACAHSDIVKACSIHVIKLSL